MAQQSADDDDRIPLAVSRPARFRAFVAAIVALIVLIGTFVFLVGVVRTEMRLDAVERGLDIPGRRAARDAERAEDREELRRLACLLLQDEPSDDGGPLDQARGTYRCDGTPTPSPSPSPIPPGLLGAPDPLAAGTHPHRPQGGTVPEPIHHATDGHHGRHADQRPASADVGYDDGSTEFDRLTEGPTVRMSYEMPAPGAGWPYGEPVVVDPPSRTPGPYGVPAPRSDWADPTGLPVVAVEDIDPLPPEEADRVAACHDDRSDGA